MSHTNSTPNYNLPQFVGTDKPTWLNDVNGAMSAIDTQMKANADSATQANTNATTAVNNTGSLANLNTTDKTSLVGAVNEINTGLGTVSGVASGASASASKANTDITALSEYFNLNTFADIPTANITINGGTITANTLNHATNANGSLGKIYGCLYIQCNNANGFSLTIPTNFRPSENITINGVALCCRKAENSQNFDLVQYVTMDIATNGNITINAGGTHYNKLTIYNFGASLLFLKDFGDTPVNN
jgi:hypothetical protein